MSAPLAAVLALALPAAAGTARVELTGELAAPAAPSGVAGFATTAAGANAPASLLVPSLAPPIALAAPSLPALNAPAIQAPVAARPLLATLAAPALQVKDLGTMDSAGAAEKDFASRAQLDAPLEAGAAATLAAAPAGAFRPLAAASKPAARAAAPAPAAAPTTLEDRDGKRMEEALARADAAKGEPVDLGFVPSPKSLRVLAEKHREFLLWRRRDDGRWRLAGGGQTMSVSETDEDYDWALHNHPMIPGLSAYTADIPTPEDLKIAQGKNARFAVVTTKGVAEWNPDLPAGFWERLTATRFGRAAVGVFLPYFYNGHVRRLGVGLAEIPWRKITPEWLERGTSPMSRALLKERVIPSAVAAELPAIAPRLGRGLDAAHDAEVKARTNGYDLWWHSAWTYKDHPDGQGVPDGHFRKDFGIRLMIKQDWAKLKDPLTHFRVLFAHEYAHWLQNEGVLSYKYGGETVAVAAELLRAVELLGVEGLRSGRAGTIHEGTIAAFESGRAWARGAMTDETALYWRGTMGGVAHEVGVIAGRPEAAWEFLRLVCGGKDALAPRAAFEKVVGRAPGA